MKRLVYSLLAGVAFTLPSVTAQAVLSVESVGVNPFPGFESTGGTGNINAESEVITKDFTAIGDVPIILHTNPSTGTDVIHIDERVINDTGIEWTDFHLTFGSIDANPALSVEFLNVTNPTGEFTTISPSTDLLSLFGTVAAGDTFSLSFDLEANSQAGSFDLFGIHEVPSITTVDEPAVLALTGLSLVLGFVTLRGRRT